jgi:hypothetical protein
MSQVVQVNWLQNEIESALNGNAFNTTVEGIGITHTMDFKEATYDVIERERTLFGMFTINNNIYLNLDGDIRNLWNEQGHH